MLLRVSSALRRFSMAFRLVSDSDHPRGGSLNSALACSPCCASEVGCAKENSRTQPLSQCPDGTSGPVTSCRISRSDRRPRASLADSNAAIGGLTSVSMPAGVLSGPMTSLQIEGAWGSETVTITRDALGIYERDGDDGRGCGDRNTARARVSCTKASVSP
jgi:hypothetical protein